MAPINGRVSGGGRGEENGRPTASLTRRNGRWGGEELDLLGQGCGAGRAPGQGGCAARGGRRPPVGGATHKREKVRGIREAAAIDGGPAGLSLA
jgi:hypothetical protein